MCLFEGPARGLLFVKSEFGWCLEGLQAAGLMNEELQTINAELHSRL